MADENGNSEARIGWGTGFMLATGPGVLTELDEVTDVSLPEETADDVEVTHFKSPNRRKEYRGGLIEPGEGSITLNYIPGSPTDLLISGAHQAGTPRAFACDLPDAEGEPEYRISGFLIVKSRSRAIPIGDRLQMTVGVRFTGASTEGAVPAGGA